MSPTLNRDDASMLARTPNTTKRAMSVSWKTPPRTCQTNAPRSTTLCSANLKKAICYAVLACVSVQPFVYGQLDNLVFVCMSIAQAR